MKYKFPFLWTASSLLLPSTNMTLHAQTAAEQGKLWDLEEPVFVGTSTEFIQMSSQISGRVNYRAPNIILSLLYFQNNGAGQEDLTIACNNYIQSFGKLELSTPLQIHDWAFNVVDGYLYTVEKNSNILYRIDSYSGDVTPLGEVPILSGNNFSYGAVYFDASGNFYVSSHQTGTIYIVFEVHTLEINGTMNSNVFTSGPSNSLNDGVRCSTAIGVTTVLYTMASSTVNSEEKELELSDLSFTNKDSIERIITQYNLGKYQNVNSTFNETQNKLNFSFVSGYKSPCSSVIYEINRKRKESYNTTLKTGLNDFSVDNDNWKMGFTLFVKSNGQNYKSSNVVVMD